MGAAHMPSLHRTYLDTGTTYLSYAHIIHTSGEQRGAAPISAPTNKRTTAIQNLYMETLHAHP